MGATHFSLDETNPDHLAKVPCPNCHAELGIHLPDPQWPTRLLGTCSECRSWYLMDCETNRMVVLAENGRFPD